VAVRRLFKVVNGGTPTADQENWDGGLLWLTPEDLGKVDGGRASKSRRTLSMKGVQTSNATFVPRGSLVLSTRAPIGYVAELSRDAATNQGCRSLVPKVALIPRYFQYQLLAARSYLESRGQSTTFSELSTEGLAGASVLFPPLKIQETIVHFLDVEVARIDELVTRKHRMIRPLAERRSGLIESAIRQLIATNGEGPLRFFVREVTVGIVVRPSVWYADEGVPALRGVNVSPGHIDREDLVYLTSEGHDLNRKSKLRAGDVVVVRTGEAGAAAVVPPDIEGATKENVSKWTDQAVM